MFSNRKIVLIIVLLVTLSITAYILIVYIPTQLAQRSYEGAKQIGRDFKEAFQFTPEVTVNNTVVLQQQTPILELATLSQKFQHEYIWNNTWLKSTKKITIKGTFEAKAGFNLNEKFSIKIDEEHATVIAPYPVLLSIESLGDVTFADENGLWNWVNTDDRSKAMNAFITDAKKYAEQAAFVKEAQQSFEAKIQAIMKQHGKTVRIQYTGEKISPTDFKY
ncbi:MAG TPA: DUF4230 domain-containing protein [Ohtaekwangia sp.]|uniref:DUF4230 domain-containing protein n=1 Tax=Ohtaekwangia sp. TaxID=2066019 RepID=UPI002F95A8F3